MVIFRSRYKLINVLTIYFNFIRGFFIWFSSSKTYEIWRLYTSKDNFIVSFSRFAENELNEILFLNPELLGIKLQVYFMVYCNEQTGRLMVIIVAHELLHLSQLNQPILRRMTFVSQPPRVVRGTNQAIFILTVVYLWTELYSVWEQVLWRLYTHYVYCYYWIICVHLSKARD